MAIDFLDGLLGPSEQGITEDEQYLEELMASLKAAQPVAEVEEEAPPEEKRSFTEGLKAFGEGITEVPARLEASNLERQGASKYHRGVLDLQELAKNATAIVPFLDTDGNLTDEGRNRFNLIGGTNDEFQTRVPVESFRKLGDSLKSGSTMRDAVAGQIDTIQTALSAAQNLLLRGEFTRPGQSVYAKALFDEQGEFTSEEARDFMLSPEASVDVLADSLHSTMLVLGAAVAGGAAGSLFGPGGATFGAMQAAGFASYTMEKKRAFLDGMLKADVDVFNAEAVLDFIGHNPDKLAKIIGDSELEGISVGVPDAIAVGIGGLGTTKALEIAATPAKKGLVALVVKAAKVAGLVATEPLVQGFLGATGAGLAKVTTGQKINKAELLVEGWAEMLAFPGEATVGTAARRMDAYNKRKQEAELDELEDLLHTSLRTEASDAKGLVTTATAQAEASSVVNEDTEEIQKSIEEDGDAFFDDSDNPEYVAPEDLEGDTITEKMQVAMSTARSKRLAKEKAKKEQADTKEALKTETAKLTADDDPADARKKELQAAFQEGRDITAAQETADTLVAQQAQDRRRDELRAEFAKGRENIAAAAERLPEPVTTPESLESLADIEKGLGTGKKQAPKPLAKVPPSTVDTTAMKGVPRIEELPEPLIPEKLKSEFTAAEIQEATDVMMSLDLSVEQVSALAKQAGFEITLSEQGIPEVTEEELSRLAEATLITARELTAKAPTAKPETTTSKQAAADKAARLAALRTSMEQQEGEGIVQDTLTDTLLQDIDYKQELKDATLEGTGGRYRREASKKLSASMTAESIERSIANKEDLGKKRKLILTSLNATLRGRKDFTHKINGGNRLGIQWQFEEVLEDGTFILVKRSLNDDGTNGKRGAVFAVNFDTQTYPKLRNEGGSADSNTDLRTLAAKPSALFPTLQAAYKDLLRNSPNLFNSNTVIRELGPARNLQRSVNKAVDDAWITVEQVARQEVAVDNALGLLNTQEGTLRKHRRKPGNYSNAEKLKARADYIRIRQDWTSAEALLEYRRDTMVTPEQAEQDMLNAQADKLEMFERGYGNARGEPGTLTDVSAFIPSISADTDADVKTFMTEEEKEGIVSQRFDRATAVQILPDGSTRVLELKVGEKDNAYRVFVTGMSDGKLSAPISIGLSKFKGSAAGAKRVALKLALDKTAATDAKSEAGKQGKEDQAVINKYLASTKPGGNKANRQGKFAATDLRRRAALIDQSQELSNTIFLLDNVGVDEASTENPTEVQLPERSADALNLEGTGERTVQDLATDEEITRIATLTDNARISERAGVVAAMQVIDEQLLEFDTLRSHGEDTLAGQVETAPGRVDEKTGKRTLPAKSKDFGPTSMFEHNYPEAARHLREVEATEARLLREVEKAGETDARKETLRLISDKIFADVRDPNPDVASAGRDALGRWSHIELQTMYTRPQLLELAKTIKAKRTGNKDVIASNIVDKLAEQPANPESAPVHEQMAAILERQGFNPQAVTTREGRAILNIGYIKAMRDNLAAKGFSEAYINVAVRNITAGTGTEQAARAQAFINSKLLDPVTIDAFRLSLKESMEMQATLKASADLTTKLGVLVDYFGTNAEGLTEKDLMGGLKTVTGTEFAKTPDYIANPTTLETELAEEVGRDNLRAEIEGLQAEDARTDRPTETLSLEGPGRPLFGATNKLVTQEDLAEAVQQLQGKFRSIGIAEGDTTALLKIAAFVVEGGARTFAEFSTQMVKRVGEKVTPRLNDLWDSVTSTANPADDPRFTTDLIRVMPPKIDPVAVIPGHRPSAKALAAIEAKLRGENPVDALVYANQNQALNELANGLSEEYLLPTIRGATPALSKMVDGIVYGSRYMTQSTGVLPPIMRDAAMYLKGARDRTNANVVYMGLFPIKLRSILNEVGVKLGSHEHLQINKAITEYISGGMRESSIRKDFGVTIPMEAKALIAHFVPHKGALSAMAALIDAVPHKTQVAIDKSGDMWLNKSFQSSPFIGQLTAAYLPNQKAMDKIAVLGKDKPALVTGMMKAAHDYYTLPAEAEGFMSIPEHQLRRLIGGTNALYKADKNGRGSFILDPHPKLDDDGNPVLNKDGSPKMLQTTLKKATHAQLVEFILKRQPDTAQIDNFIRDMINSITEPKVGTTMGASAKGSDQSILKPKRLMQSQSAQIKSMIRDLQQAPNIDQDIVKALKEQQEDFSTYSRAEFVAELSAMDADMAAALDRSELEFAMTDVIREALHEITDPGALMVNSVAKIAGTIELSKALTAIVEMGINSGELAVGSTDIIAGKHTAKLGILRGKRLVAGLADTQYRDPRGEVHKVIEDGRPTIAGTPATINGLHDLIGAHAALETNLFMKTMYGAAAYTKYDKIILSFTAHPRNAVSSTEIAWGRGVFGTYLNPLVHAYTNPGAFLMGSRLALTELQQTLGEKQATTAANRLLSDEYLGNLAVAAAGRGITHDSIHTGTVIDLFSHLQTLSPDEWGMVMSNQTSLIRARDGRLVLASSKAGQAISMAASGVTTTAETMFRLEDEAIKIVAFLQRTGQFLIIQHPGTRQESMAYANKLVRGWLSMAGRKAMSVNELAEVELSMDMAAVNVIATFPTFSQAPQGIKALGRAPYISAFPTFNAEMVRNSYNHFMFSQRLIRGQLPLGVQLEGKAKERASKLGWGLMSQGFLVIAGQMLGLAMMNLVSMRAGRDPQDDDESASKLLAEAIVKHRYARDAYEFKNVFPGWYQNSNIMLVPGTLDVVNHTSNYIPTGFTMSEGAVLEAGYTLWNDAARIMGNDDLREHFKDKMMYQLGAAFMQAMGGLWFNEEVLISDFTDNLLARTGHSSENIDSVYRSFRNDTNQWIRSALTPNDNPWAEQTGEQGSEIPRQIGALITAVAGGLPPNTAVSQVIKAGQSIKSSAEMAENPATFVADVLTNTAAITGGVKYIEFNFMSDYEKKLRFQHAPSMMTATDTMLNSLFDPSWRLEGTEEQQFAEFKEMFDLQEGFRRNAFNNIHAALNTGHAKYGVSEEEMDVLWGKASGSGNSNITLDGFTQKEYRLGYYHSPVLSGNRTALFQDRFDEAGTGSYAIRRRWYNSLVNEEKL